MKARKYEFSTIKKDPPCTNYGHYWSWTAKDFGRYFFKEAVQGFGDDLADDPWGLGNPDINDI